VAAALVVAVVLGALVTAATVRLAEWRARAERGDEPQAPAVPWVPSGPFGGHPAIEGWVPSAGVPGTVPRATDPPPDGRVPSSHVPGGPHGRPAARRCRRNLDHRW